MMHTPQGVVLWGGADPFNRLIFQNGWRLEPTSHTEGAPQSIGGTFYAWTGRELVIWGGYEPRVISPDPDEYEPPRGVDTGAAHDPATDSWRPVPSVGAPPPMFAKSEVSSVWTGSEMIVIGDKSVHAYDPERDSWRQLSLKLPEEFYGSAVWTGSEVLIVNSGGECPATIAHDPVTDTSRFLSREGGPRSKGFMMTWTRSEALVWARRSRSSPRRPVAEAVRALP